MSPLQVYTDFDEEEQVLQRTLPPLVSISSSLARQTPAMQLHRSLRLSAVELMLIVNAGMRFPFAERLEVLGSLSAGMQDGFLESRFHLLTSFPSLRHLALYGGRNAPLLPAWDIAGWDQLRSLDVHVSYGNRPLWEAWSGVRNLRLDFSGLTTADEVSAAWVNVSCLRRVRRLTVVSHTYIPSAVSLQEHHLSCFPHLSQLTVQSRSFIDNSLLEAIVEARTEQSGAFAGLVLHIILADTPAPSSEYSWPKLAVQAGA